MRHIDVHQHLGHCRVFDLEVRAPDLQRAIEATGVDGCILQPFPGAQNASAQHDAIASFAAQAPFQVWGMASMNPHCDDRVYRDEIYRCVRDLGFAGVKLHTIGHAVNPGGADATKVFETAAELDIPVMVHTGDGVPFADPAAILVRAREFPELKIVLAHAGGGTFTTSAIAVARTTPNVYLEPSWCKTPEIGGMIDLVGADRVMFGADLPHNILPEKEKFAALGLSARDIDACLWGTASTVYRLDM